MLTLAVVVLSLLAACRTDGYAEAPSGLSPAATPAVTAARGAATPAAEATSAPVEPTATTGGSLRDELPVIEFVRSDGSVVTLAVEVPPRSEYSIGLSGRHELDERGMLFHYPEERRMGFWMKNTHVDLSIAFVDADFRIGEIHEMQAESLDILHSDADYQYAIEAPAGWYAAHGIEVGDEARFTFELPDEDPR